MLHALCRLCYTISLIRQEMSYKNVMPPRGFKILKRIIIIRSVSDLDSSEGKEGRGVRDANKHDDPPEFLSAFLSVYAERPPYKPA